MNENVTSSPALGFMTQYYFEYLLLINPSEEVSRKFMTEKERFSFSYNVSSAGKTKPHITIANFLAKETMEETLIKWMHKAISNQQSFDVMINNYSGFPSSQTIYARVQNNEQFKNLTTSLRVINDYIKSNGFPAARLITNPHVTIARRLPAQVYEKALKDYSQQTFNASFKVNELILVKRQNQYDKCKQVAMFKLTASYTA